MEKQSGTADDDIMEITLRVMECRVTGGRGNTRWFFFLRSRLKSLLHTIFYDIFSTLRKFREHRASFCCFADLLCNTYSQTGKRKKKKHNRAITRVNLLFENTGESALIICVFVSNKKITNVLSMCGTTFTSSTSAQETGSRGKVSETAGLVPAVCLGFLSLFFNLWSPPPFSPHLPISLPFYFYTPHFPCRDTSYFERKLYKNTSNSLREQHNIATTFQHHII